MLQEGLPLEVKENQEPDFGFKCLKQSRYVKFAITIVTLFHKITHLMSGSDSD